MKITIKNIIKENKDIDPKQRFVNEISRIIRPPYFKFLRVNEVPRELWEDILSNIFNTKVTYSNNVIYDSNNNEIYQEKSNGYWEKREYNENNNKIYYENSDGFWEKREYDENNNLIYRENSNGYWSKREYDENNNKIYQLDSTGNWLKQEYDSNNNLIYYEDYEGYWSKSEFDENKNLIYYENSDGFIRDYRPRNSINENKDIDPKQRFVNEISRIIRPPYFKFLRVNEVPRELWDEIFSKLFNQEVIISDNVIYDSNNNEIYYEDSDGFWVKSEYDSNNNLIYSEDSNGYWSKSEFDENKNLIYYENSDGFIRDYIPRNSINENTDPKQRYVNGILNMIRRPYMGFLIDNEVPEELWKEILSKIFNTNDISWEKRIIDNKILYELIIQDEKGKQLYYEIPDYWEQLIYGYHNRLDMDFTRYINSVGNKKVTFVGKHNTVVYSNGPTGYPWSGLSDDIKNNKFFDINY